MSFIERCPLFRGSFIRGFPEVGVRERRKKGGDGEREKRGGRRGNLRVRDVSLGKYRVDVHD